MVTAKNATAPIQYGKSLVTCSEKCDCSAINGLLLLFTSWGHCVSSFCHIQGDSHTFCVSSVHPSWFPGMGDTGVSTSVSTNSNTSSILHTRVKTLSVPFGERWQKVACCCKDGALWLDSKPTLNISYHRIMHDNGRTLKEKKQTILQSPLAIQLCLWCESLFYEPVWTHFFSGYVSMRVG